MVFALLYTSVAETALNGEELTALLSTSRRRNEADGLTGLLLHVHAADGGAAFFVQVLEGEQAAVERTYERIAGDELHHDLRVLERGPVPERRFADWAMQLDQISVPELRAGLDGSPEDLIRDARAMNDLLTRRYG